MPNRAPTPNQPAPLAMPRRWWDRFLGGAAGNVLLVLLIGLYYDARKEEPGLVVWLAIVMCLPTWLVLAILRRSELARWLEEQRPNIELIDAVRERVSEQGSITNVVNTLLPDDQKVDPVKESSDAERL